MLGDIPYAKEPDLYVDGKGMLELYALLEIFALVHLKRERQLFEVV
jgi:hypothetical protein